MKYLTAYVYEKQTDKNQESLCLVQAGFGRKEAVLACICGGGLLGAHITKRMKLWFSERGPVLFGKSSGEKAALKEFQQFCCGLEAEAEVVERKMDSGDSLGLSAVLAVGQECLLVQAGGGICLLNRRFLQDHSKWLRIGGEKPGWQMQEAWLEHGVGILLGRKEWLGVNSKETLCSCLGVSALKKEEQMEARLREYVADCGRQAGLQAGGVILLRSM